MTQEIQIEDAEIIQDQVEPVPAEECRFNGLINEAKEMFVKYPTYVAPTLHGLTEDEFNEYKTVLASRTDEEIESLIRTHALISTFNVVANFYQGTGLPIPTGLDLATLLNAETTTEKFEEIIRSAGASYRREEIVTSDGNRFNDYVFEYRMDGLSTMTKGKWHSTDLPLFVVGLVSIHLVNKIPNEYNSVRGVCRTLAAVETIGTYEALTKARDEWVETERKNKADQMEISDEEKEPTAEKTEV